MVRQSLNFNIYFLQLRLDSLSRICASLYLLGKTITASKRRITFQFGFSSADAISSGKTAADCRGEEHEVVLVWSHITGKRQLFTDGREFHTSKAARGNTRFEFSWTIPGNHVLKIVANGAPPITAEGARQFKQFDLQLDGMSYFDFAKIYELGEGEVASSPRMVDRADSPVAPSALTYSYRGAAYDDARDDYAEEEEEEVRRPLPQAPAMPAVDLFDSQPSLASRAGSIPSLVMCDSNTYSLQSSSSYYYDEFAPIPATSRSSFDSISNEILGAYNSAPSQPAIADAAPSSSRALVPVSEEGMDPVARSFKNLVNLDDIATTPSYGHASLRANKAAAPPAPGSWGHQVGRAPTLAEMRESQTPSPTVPAWPVVKAHEHYPQAGYHSQPQALVPYGAAPPSFHNGYGNPGQYGYGNQAQAASHGNPVQYRY